MVHLNGLIVPRNGPSHWLTGPETLFELLDPLILRRRKMLHSTGYVDLVKWSTLAYHIINKMVHPTVSPVLQNGPHCCIISLAKWSTLLNHLSCKMVLPTVLYHLSCKMVHTTVSPLLQKGSPYCITCLATTV